MARGTSRPGSRRMVCGRPTGKPISGNRPFATTPWPIPDLERRRTHRHAALRCGDVVVRERVVRPTGQQQHRASEAVPRSRINSCGSAYPRIGTRPEVIRIAAVERRQFGQHIVPMLIDAHARAAGPARPTVSFKGGRGGDRSPSFGNTSTSSAMIDGDSCTRSKNSASSSSLVSRSSYRPSRGLQLIAADPDVFVRIRVVPDCRRQPGAHLAAAHEVGHELEPRSVPGEQIRAGRRLAIELGDRAAARRRRRRSASAVSPVGLGLQDA